MTPKKSATRWSKQGKGLGFEVFPLATGEGALKFKNTLEMMARKAHADLLIFDTPPQIADATMLTALVADFVLVPVGASALDIWAAQAAVELIGDAHAESAATACRFTPWCPRASSWAPSWPGSCPESLLKWVRWPRPSATGVAIVESPLVGQTVADYAPSSLAHQEYEALGLYVLRRLKEVANA